MQKLEIVHSDLTPLKIGVLYGPVEDDTVNISRQIHPVKTTSFSVMS